MVVPIHQRKVVEEGNRVLILADKKVAGALMAAQVDKNQISEEISETSLQTKDKLATQVNIKGHTVVQDAALLRVSEGWGR